MSHENEDEIRYQFLSEAQEHVATLETTLSGLAGQRTDLQVINTALRTAHSLKGGAAMMDFRFLSELAHRLEDNLKALKVDSSITIDADLESFLLAAVNCLYRTIEFDRQRQPIDPAWIVHEVEPIYDALKSRVGEAQPETAASVLSMEDNHQDVIPLIFETEVEECLQRLETALFSSDQPFLREEALTVAQDLAGLGEMLGLPAFEALSKSAEERLRAASTVQEEFAVAQSAFQTWRHTQAKVISGYADEIPTQLEVTAPVEIKEGVPEEKSVAGEVKIAPPDVRQVTHEVRSLSQQTKSIPLAVTPIEEGEQDVNIRVSMRQLNLLQNFLGELTIDRNGLEINVKRLRNLMRQLQQRIQVLQQENRKLRAVYDSVPSPDSSKPAIRDGSQIGNPGALVPLSSFPGDFDLLELDRYTDEHLLSQQVMETIVQLQEVTDDLSLSLDDTEQNTRNLNKTARQLQSGLNRLRMRPFSDLIERFPRALREWCAQYDKQARLEIRGDSLLLDRNILEHLQDPLMHLLRNAFDHGIESPHTRVARGKSPDGVIEIQALQQGNRTLITIRDDGEGIPIDKIRGRAAQLGLDPSLLATASETELLTLIFEPGFSTKDEVSELSGRGMGMDIVRTQLQYVRGEITVDTQEGRGTTFTLSVPVTLSTVRVVLAEANGMLLALPSDAIAEVVLFNPQLVMETVGGKVIDYQGQVVPLIRLHDKLVFHCPRAPHDYEVSPLLPASSILVLRQGEEMVAIHVDRCWSDQEVTVRSIAGLFPMPSGFNGCTVLGDGRVVALVNVAEFLHEITNQVPVQQPYLPTEIQKVLPTTTPEQPVILIVDDSVNVRRFLAATLTKAGYQVEQAKDGQEAFDRLEQGLRVQAVICDIEMPRLDGFGLLTKLKAQPALRHIPVTMLTSRSGEKHRRLATQLGAEAYFPKPYNEQELLRTLQGFVDRGFSTTASQ
jgi:two-component system, chemotaxis family, sensor histidine kinase and response regulator PixL